MSDTQYAVQINKITEQDVGEYSITISLQNDESKKESEYVQKIIIARGQAMKNFNFQFNTTKTLVNKKKTQKIKPNNQ